MGERKKLVEPGSLSRVRQKNRKANRAGRNKIKEPAMLRPCERSKIASSPSQPRRLSRYPSNCTGLVDATERQVTTVFHVPAARQLIAGASVYVLPRHDKRFAPGGETLPCSFPPCSQPDREAISPVDLHEGSHRGARAASRQCTPWRRHSAYRPPSTIAAS